MKLTNNDLRRIIKEELNAVLRETGDSGNVDLWETMTKLRNLTSKGSGQLTTIPEEDMSFYADGGLWMEGFTLDDAIKQLEGKRVKRGNNKQWESFELYGGYWVPKKKDTEDVEGETDPEPEPTEEPEENKTPEEKYPYLSQSEEVFFSLAIERPGTLEFHMRLILESGEEPRIFEIQGQNVHENLEEILSYFVAPEEDILEMANELIRLNNLSKTSLP